MPESITLIPAPLSKINLSGRYDLYVDGSPGPKVREGWSGWGIALMAGPVLHYEQCGTTAERITSNAVELEAIIQGLAFLQRLNAPSVITLWTDSKYSNETLTKLPQIADRGYCNEKLHPVANADRIKLIFELLYDMEMVNQTVIRWVKGHDKTLGNDIADELSKKASNLGMAYYLEHTHDPA